MGQIPAREGSAVASGTLTPPNFFRQGASPNRAPHSPSKDLVLDLAHNASEQVPQTAASRRNSLLSSKLKPKRRSTFGDVELVPHCTLNEDWQYMFN
jgi:hypothetical protein